MNSVILSKFVIFALTLACSSAFNVETREVLKLFLRDGGASIKNESTPSAYAGYSFDAKMDGNVVRMIVGQPRAGKSGSTESPGSLYSCNVSAFVLNVSSHQNCSQIDIFDHSNPQGRSTDHKTDSDAIGLNLGRIGGTSQYAVCAPVRQRKCPNGVSHVPGACYYGSPDENYWNFFKWNETKCMEDIIDIIFVVDGSSSIGDANFVIVKQWLINVTTSLMMELGEAARTEVLQYSEDHPKRPWGLTIEASTKFVIPYTLNDVLTINQMAERIRLMKHLKKGTYTAYALERTMKVEFQRSDFDSVSRKVIVVLTDGKATDGVKLPKWYTDYKDKVTTFAVGVGKYDFDQLRQIANGKTSNDRVFTVDNFDQLQSEVEILTSAITSEFNEGTNGRSGQSPGQDIGSPQIGTAISSTKDGRMLFGAAGMYLDSGMVIEFDNSSVPQPTLSSYQNLHTILPNRTTDSYLGYSVATGFFDGPGLSEYIATGAPRYLLVGAVVVYQSISGGPSFSNSVTIMAPANLRQIAAYFGACVLSVDVSGDGKEDLLVGSPLFVGDNYDEGRVFVYISQKSASSPLTWADATYVPIQLYGGGSRSGRFGTAMANAGDLNLDGFNDIIIGAPLADDGIGEVFVYHGKKNGIEEQFSQKIQASTFVGMPLRYFGQSLQGNIDIDGNQYPDILIGAPKSDSVVMMRTRPIIKISTELRFEEATIHIFECLRKNYQNCTSIRACFFANGTSVESSIGISYNLTLDTLKTRDGDKRLQFGSSVSTLSRNINISTGIKHCFTRYLHVKNHLEKDFDTVINANLVFDLTSSHKATPLSSVLDVSIPNSMNANITFAKQCRSDTCVADLQLAAEMTLPVYSGPEGVTVLMVASSTASDPSIVKVNLTNIGENAFDTRVKVTYPFKISLSSVVTISSSPPTSSCIVELGSPIRQGSQVVNELQYNSAEGIMQPNSWCVFKFNVITDNLKKDGTFGEFTLNMSTFTNSTSSTENITSDNIWMTSRRINYLSDFHLRREQGNKEITFNDSAEEKNITGVEEIGTNTPDIVMDFRVTGDGYSNIPSAEITLKYPWMTEEGNPLLYLFKLDCATQGITTCSCDTSTVNQYNLTAGYETQNSTGEEVEMKPATASLDKTQLDCLENGANSTHTCETLTCNVSNLGDSDAVHFVAYFRLWTASITFSGTNHSQVDIISHFQISTANSPYIVNSQGDNVTIVTEEFRTTAKKYVVIPDIPTLNPLWIYILASAGGLILLALVVLVLYLCGFFKKSGWKTMTDEAKMKIEEETDFPTPSPIARPIESDLSGSPDAGQENLSNILD